MRQEVSVWLDALREALMEVGKAKILSDEELKRVAAIKARPDRSRRGTSRRRVK